MFDGVRSPAESTHREQEISPASALRDVGSRRKMTSRTGSPTSVRPLPTTPVLAVPISPNGTARYPAPDQPRRISLPLPAIPSSPPQVPPAPRSPSAPPALGVRPLPPPPAHQPLPPLLAAKPPSSVDLATFSHLPPQSPITVVRCPAVPSPLEAPQPGALRSGEPSTPPTAARSSDAVSLIPPLQGTIPSSASPRPCRPRLKLIMPSESRQPSNSTLPPNSQPFPTSSGSHDSASQSLASSPVPFVGEDLARVAQDSPHIYRGRANQSVNRFHERQTLRDPSEYGGSSTLQSSRPSGRSTQGKVAQSNSSPSLFPRNQLRKDSHRRVRNTSFCVTISGVEVTDLPRKGSFSVQFCAGSDVVRRTKHVKLDAEGVARWDEALTLRIPVGRDPATRSVLWKRGHRTACAAQPLRSLLRMRHRVAERGGSSSAVLDNLWVVVPKRMRY
ncbi:hypothetical protein BV22DRAFT_1117239 [Leucogyrophana mollusca]|uniref:Uncharacterized protein n=1 Tax=Leucogyrophana mollusca TaxID=85980 RepID=A0ACB8BUH2_9AGAM|nr:hypothetical protein BV22DRAFT_1117239 [Leucogyrophana mollusca]